MAYVEIARPPKSWISDSEYSWGERPTCWVYEPKDDPIDTGLLSSAGVRLYRLADREAIGFRVRRKGER